MDSICTNCQRRRRVAAESLQKEGYIGCKIQDMCYLENISEDEILNNIDAETIAYGWVDLGAKPGEKSSGIITNEQLVTRGTRSCKYKSKSTY